ncbi:MAG: type VI secretion system contractile sheath large subunit [Pyrinomonadaceae bacterium]
MAESFNSQKREPEWETGLLDQIRDALRTAGDESWSARIEKLIREFLRQARRGDLGVSGSLKSALDERINGIDRLLSGQINEIIHHEEFQKLEGSWRGLLYLVENSLTSPRLKIRVATATKRDLLKDFERSPEPSRSWLFEKLYADEYGHWGATPFGALIGDFEFGKDPPDVAVLTHVAQVAAFAHAPFISAAAPGLFGWQTFSEMIGIGNLGALSDRGEYAKWSGFRKSEESRYVGLIVPHILGRKPYTSGPDPIRSFRFEEDVTGPDGRNYLWCNAAYAFGTRLTEAFLMHGWCAAICGAEGGGLVDNLPTGTFKTDGGEARADCPVEIAVTDRLEKQFTDNGFIPLIHLPDTAHAVFEEIPAAIKPGKYDTETANILARQSRGLQYVFAVSRFAHYLKLVMRDSVVSFISREEAARFLNRWLSKYLLGYDPSPADSVKKSRYPLNEGLINLNDDPENPAACRAVVFINPHFQIGPLPVALRIVVNLPKRYGDERGYADWWS